MKYVTLLVFLLAAWLLINEFVLKDRRREGLDTYGEKLKDLGGRFHLVIGILAVLVLILMVIRLVISVDFE